MTKMDDDGHSSVVVSINLKRVHLFLSVLVLLITLVAGAASAGHWIKQSIRSVAQEEFKNQLTVFHETAIPQIEKLMEAKIQAHSLGPKPQAPETKDQLAAHDTRITVNEARWMEANRRLERIETKLDDVLRERR